MPVQRTGREITPAGTTLRTSSETVYFFAFFAFFFRGYVWLDERLSMKEMVPRGLGVAASAIVLVYVVLAASDLLAFPG
jgi:hypothetical protein